MIVGVVARFVKTKSFFFFQSCQSCPGQMTVTAFFLFFFAGKGDKEEDS